MRLTSDAEFSVVIRISRTVALADKAHNCTRSCISATPSPRGVLHNGVIPTRRGRNLLIILPVNRQLRDTVQISHPTLRDASTALSVSLLALLDLLNDPQLLERLQHLAVDGAGCIDVVAWSRASILCGPVDLAEAADADRFA